MSTYNFTNIITQEGKYYIARCVELGVVSQGKSIEESIKNLKEAVELYLDDMPKDDLKEYTAHQPLISTLQVEYA